MGLDITHNKAVLSRPENINPFTENYVTQANFSGFDVNFQYFKPYIQQIEIPEVITTLIFIKDSTSKQNVIRQYFKTGYHVFGEKEASQLSEAVHQFLIKNQLTNQLLWRFEAPDWTGFYVYHFKKETGFYYQEAGYQRKGMNEHFWERFQSDTIFHFTKKEDFEYALACVDYCWESDTSEDVLQRKKQFQTDFVDQYEEGKSFLSLSY